MRSSSPRERSGSSEACGRRTWTYLGGQGRASARADSTDDRGQQTPAGGAQHPAPTRSRGLWAVNAVARRVLCQAACGPCSSSCSSPRRRSAPSNPPPRSSMRRNRDAPDPRLASRSPRATTREGRLSWARRELGTAQATRRQARSAQRGRLCKQFRKRAEGPSARRRRHRHAPTAAPPSHPSSSTSAGCINSRD